MQAIRDYDLEVTLTPKTYSAYAWTHTDSETQEETTVYTETEEPEVGDLTTDGEEILTTTVSQEGEVEAISLGEPPVGYIRDKDKDIEE